MNIKYLDCNEIPYEELNLPDLRRSEMSHWNFRMIDLNDENGGDPWIELCEVHYNDAAVPVGYSNPCVGSETVEGMKQLVAWYALALDKPVMQKSEFVGSFDDDDDEEQ